MEVPDGGESGQILYLPDIAKRLNCVPRTVYRMASAGELPGLYKVQNRWAMRSEDFEAWLVNREEQQNRFSPAMGGRQRPKSASLTYEGTVRAEAFLTEAFSAVGKAIATLKTLQDKTANLVTPANENGITAIYAPRAVPQEGVSANDAMAELVEKATGLILLQGTTLRHFFHDKGLRRLLVQRLQEGHIRVKALLLDPCSVSACARVTIEEAKKGGNEYTHNPKKLSESQTFVDVQRTITTIQEFRNYGFQVDARFYDCMPFAFFILTNSGMLLEQYHLGRDVDTVDSVCIGEQVPLLRVAPDTPFYKKMWNSFRTLWFVGGPDDDEELAFKATSKSWENIFLSVKELDQVYKEVTALREVGHWPKRKSVELTNEP